MFEQMPDAIGHGPGSAFLTIVECFLTAERIGEITEVDLVDQLLGGQ